MSQASPQTPTTKPSYMALLEPLRTRDFLYFWYAETMSRFGNQFQSVALATVVMALTGEASTLAGVLMVQNIPAALLALIGGVATDRFGARRVMISANAVWGLIVTWLAFLGMQGSLSLTHLYVYALASGILGGLFNPASSSITPSLIPKSHLPAGVALYRLSNDLSRSVAAPLAGAVVAAFGAVPAFALNAASFLQAAWLETLIRAPAAMIPKSASAGLARPSVLQQLLEGLRVVRNDRVLIGQMTASVLSSLGSAGTTLVGLPALAQISLKTGPGGQGLLLGAIGVGNFVGSVLVGKNKNFGAIGGLFTRMCLINAGCLAAVAMAPNIYMCVPFLFVYGVSTSYLFVVFTVLAQTRPAAAFRGRVMSVVTLCSTGVFWLSYAIAGVVAKPWGPRGVLVVLGVFMPLLASLIPYFNKEYSAFRIDVR